MTTLSCAFLLSSEDSPRARNLRSLHAEQNAKTPSSRSRRGSAIALSATYLRDDSGSGAHESDDDAEGNDWERAKETDKATRTMVRIIAIGAFDASPERGKIA